MFNENFPKTNEALEDLDASCKQTGLEYIQESLKVYAKAKADIKELEFQIGEIKNTIKNIPDEFANFMLQEQLSEIGIPDVGTFQVKQENKVFWPAKGALDKRQQVLQYVMKKYGKDYVTEIVNVNYKTLMGLRQAAFDAGELKENESIPGTIMKTDYGIKITKQQKQGVKHEPSTEQ